MQDGLNMVATAVQTLLNGILVWQSVRTAMRATQNQTPDAAGAV